MHGRPPRMSGRREISAPISVTVAIEFKYNALWLSPSQHKSLSVIGKTREPGLAWSHWIGLAAGLALAWIGTIIRTRIEDRLLRTAFGPEFDAYARGVPELIPGRRRG